MQPASNLHRFGPFCLDLTEHVLLRDGQLVHLPPKAFLTLLVLVRNCGHVVEKDALLNELWPDQDVEESNLAQNIFILRRALGETTSSPTYIETVPRRGYRFVGAVTGGGNSAAGRAYFPTKRYTENPEAYKAYLRGRYLWSKHTSAGLEQSTECFQAAINLDPAYALANAAVVDCLLRLATNYLPPADALPQTAAAIQRSDLNEASPEVQALIKMRYRLDRMTAEQDIRRAVDLNSTYPHSYQWHAAREIILSRLNQPSGGNHNAFMMNEQNPALTEASLEQQLESISLTRDEQVQILCTIARQQFDASNYEAGRIVLKDWWTIGEWPNLKQLSHASAAELLFIAGAVARRAAATKLVQRGPKNAEELLNGSIALCEQLGLKTPAAEGRIQLAFCYSDQGLYDLARTVLFKVLAELANEDQETKCKALIILADLDLHSWRLQESFARMGEARELLEQSSILVTGRYHNVLGGIFEYRGLNEKRAAYFDRAIHHYEVALQQMEAIGDHRSAGRIDNNYACLLMKLQRFDEAEFHLLRARKRLYALGDTYLCAQVDDSLAQLHLGAGRFEVALQAANRAVGTMKSSSQQVYLAEDLLTQGIALCRLGRLHEAKRTLHQACYAAERCGDFDQAGNALLIVMEEMFAQLEETERSELARELNRLLADSQQTTMRERLGKCLERIAAVPISQDLEPEQRRAV
jgi:DNA-binding winged helix-turn-helix (wHTH) protein